MSTKINLKNTPMGFQTIINNGRHSILGDEPVPSKGTDLGFSPPDLILSSLGMCKVATVRYIARKKGWAIGDVEAELEQQVKRGPAGEISSHVTVAIRIEGDLTEEQRKELIREADACYIHRMINGEWMIESATELDSATKTAGQNLGL